MLRIQKVKKDQSLYESSRWWIWLCKQLSIIFTRLILFVCFWAHTPGNTFSLPYSLWIHLIIKSFHMHFRESDQEFLHICLLQQTAGEHFHLACSWIGDSLDGLSKRWVVEDFRLLHLSIWKTCWCILLLMHQWSTLLYSQILDAIKECVHI